jgi:hypothetical protein
MCRTHRTQHGSKHKTTIWYLAPLRLSGPFAGRAPRRRLFPCLSFANLQQVHAVLRNDAGADFSYTFVSVRNFALRILAFHLTLPFDLMRSIAYQRVQILSQCCVRSAVLLSKGLLNVSKCLGIRDDELRIANPHGRNAGTISAFKVFLRFKRKYFLVSSTFIQVVVKCTARGQVKLGHE